MIIIQMPINAFDEDDDSLEGPTTVAGTSQTHESENQWVVRT